MKRTTNAIQEAYMLAVAVRDELDSRMMDIEREYITANGIINQDGTAPDRIWCIEDSDTFDRANAETAAILECSGLWADVLKSRAALKVAEEELIRYGLSIAPASVRETLSNSAAHNYATRQKIIDLVFKLDVSTVKA